MTQQKLTLTDSIPYEDLIAAKEEDETGVIRFYYDYFHFHADDVTRLIYSKISDPEEASELRQETLLRALEKRSQLKEKNKSCSWIKKIAYNVMADYFREQQKWKFVEEEEWDPESEKFSAGDLTFATTCRNCQVELLREVLERLPKQHQEVIRLHHFYDLTFTEIAERLGESPGTITSWYYRSCKKLKQWLEEEGGF